jgi:hypothetical protein
MFLHKTQLVGLAFIATMVFGCNTTTETLDPPDNRFYVEFTADGEEVLYEDGQNNYGNGPGIESYPDSAGRLHSQFTTFIRSALDPNYDTNILTIQMVSYWPDTIWVLYNTSFLMFDEGTYDYGSWNEDSTYFGINGAVITFTDGNGKIWSSDQLYGTQESWSNFEITDHKAVDETQYGAKTKGTFECRVFDGQGESIDLRNGNFHARTIFKHE